jgi:hypothetical protein
LYCSNISSRTAGSFSSNGSVSANMS